MASDDALTVPVTEDEGETMSLDLSFDGKGVVAVDAVEGNADKLDDLMIDPLMGPADQTGDAINKGDNVKQEDKVAPLRGPAYPGDVVTESQREHYEFSAPSGSYGQNVDEENPEVPAVAIVHATSSAPLPAFSDLLDSRGQSYEREELLALRDSPQLADIWRQNYQEVIQSTYPQLYRPPDVEPLDNGEPDDAEEARLLLRGYQHEFAERGLRGENDIVLLPTGSGKTYIVIEIIIQHLAERAGDDNAKVIFLAPTQDLVSQQLKLMRRYLDRDRCRSISGDDSLSAELVARFIRGREYLVLAVTPAIIENYFLTSREASMSDFTLLVFDEMHHTKKLHNYNMIVHKYLRAFSNGQRPLPQLIGMTATIGIGRKETVEGARDHILDMCAKYNLTASPWRQQLYLSQRPPIEQRFALVESRTDGLTTFIEYQLMATLEECIIDKLDEDRIRHLVGQAAAAAVPDIEFPQQRLSQVYEQYIVSLLKTMTELPYRKEWNSLIQYCKLALRHLREYHRSLQLIDLLTCKYGFLYLQKMLKSPEYRGVSSVWELFEGNVATVEGIQATADDRSPNQKLVKLTKVLKEQFTDRPDSKVIIFVQRRMVAKYLAQYLSETDDMFLAKEFTSIGKSPEDAAGMSPQQRLDVRAKFEGSNYNILVATSVLEEGIDIQACILVVRYMYVKDMIAKIQSMGRARHEQGRLVSFLDEKLMKQERENERKAVLMFEALQHISELTNEEFQAQVRQRLPHLLLSLKSTAHTSYLKQVDPNIEIRCALCSNFLGFLKDVRVFQKSHHLVLDHTINERVLFLPRSRKLLDGLEKVGPMYCNFTGTDGSVCRNPVGQVVQMGCGYNFGMWRAKGGISVKVGAEMREVKQWKDIRNEYLLDTIYIEDLREVGFPHQFVYTSATSPITIE